MIALRLTLDDVAIHAGMHPAFVDHLVQFGLLTPIEQEGAQMFFDISAVSRLRAIALLNNGLGINLADVSVILGVVDKVSAVQRDPGFLKHEIAKEQL
jgi:DNA-binding transcriptional MerR regulator